MNQKGFTITELLISIAVGSVVSSILLFITFNYIGDVTRARMTAELAIESQQLLRSMVEDTRLAASLSSTNQNPDANQPDGGWLTNDPSNIIVIDVPVTDQDKNIIYNEDTSLPYTNEIVYFSNGSDMYRRVITDPNAVGNGLKTSCPPSLATEECPSDKLFTKYLTDLTFTFYDSAGATTADATQARSVQITVRVERKIFGKPVKFANTIKTTLRNR